MDILRIIEELEDLIIDAPKVPFGGGKVMVDSNKAVELLNKIKEDTPKEVKQAEWIISEKERILAESHKEANAIKKEAQDKANQIEIVAKEKFEKLVNENNITRESENYGRQIVKKAEQNALMLKKQSITYIDEMLATTQDKLKDMLATLEENRNELKKG